MTRYRWLHHPTDTLPGLLVATIGSVCFAVMVERTETGWRMTQSDGTTEMVPALPDTEDDPPDGPDAAA